MKLKTINKLNTLIKKPSFTAKEARERGVSSSNLAYYARNKQIEKLSRGIYRGIEGNREAVPFEWEDLIVIALSIPKGVVCLISALAIYELTDEFPRQFWIAVKNYSRAPTREKTKIIRMRDITTGVTKVRLGTVKVNIFDRERTIIDAFRYLSKEIAIKALRNYLISKKQKPDLMKLLDYSKKLRCPIKTYIETLTT